MTSWNKFNNYYFWQSGGLSLNEVVPEETSVVYQENQENIENYIISLKEFLEMADLPAQEKKNIKHLLFKFFASEKDQNRYEIEERYTSLHYASEEQRKQTTWNEKISTSSPQYGGQIHQEVRRVVKPADSKKEKKAEEVLKVPEEVLEKPEEVLEKPEEIVEKEKVESGCILSNELIDTLSNEGNVVLECLAEFCATDKKTLLQVLHQRNTPAPNPSRQKFIPGGYLSFGYRKYQKKVNTKFRTLRTPSKELMQIQETLRKRFMCIPVSLKSQAGKPGDSSEKNAELHRYHPYLITLDIKSAYPSITTERVYKNLKGALERTLDIWTPLLISEDLEQTEKNKDLFIRAITHLCVSENELPQ
ncbi:MAG: hypothetical protein LBO09_00410 [Candidatus Peribacteria bacterium]|nr:hypothetical protein [Candidatus Peribacteria bacterium]